MHKKTPGSFESGNAAAMTRGGVYGALDRDRKGQEQRLFVQEMKAQKLQEFERVGRQGWLIDRLASLDTLADLCEEQAQERYAERDIDGLYRAVTEFRKLIGEATKLVREHRAEEEARGTPVLDAAVVEATNGDSGGSG